MNIAVVGASNNAEKYGNRIVRHLLENGHTVFPVNLKEKTILSQPAFKHLKDITQKVDIVNFVVPPKATYDVLHEAKKHLHGVDIWIQPGAESEKVLAYLERHNKDFGRITYNACIMTSLDRQY